MELCGFSFHKQDEVLMKFASSILKDYPYIGELSVESIGEDTQETENLSGLLLIKADSDGAKKKHVLGDMESGKNLKGLFENVKLVSLKGQNMTQINLWVNEKDIVRAFIFINGPKLLLDRYPNHPILKTIKVL